MDLNIPVITPYQTDKASFLCRYGITLFDYEEMLRNQGYRCKICGVLQIDIKQSMQLDHNHKNFKVRGILCPSCNKGLGFFKDNPEFLKEAIKYLDSN